MKKILLTLLVASGSYLGYSQCTAIAAPWLDGFEAFSTNQTITNQNCWRSNDNGVSNPPRWQTENLGTGSSPTGPSGPFAGSRYAYLETSTSEGTDSLITPEIDISGLTYPGLKFYYHMFGESIGTLSIDVYDGTSWSPVLWSISGEQQTSNGAPWTEVVVSLTSVPGNIIQIRFAGNNVAGTINPTFFFRGDMGIDNVEVFECTPSASTISAVSCGYYTAPSGKQIHAAGTYLDTIPNAIGCDSVITINLTSNNTSSNINLNNLCGTYTMPSGLVVGQDGAYTDTSTNSVGCDSVIFYNLTFDNTNSLYTAAACNVYTAPSGATYSLSGVILDTIPNAVGCDSFMVISLTMSFDNSITIFETTCGDPYISNAGNSYPTTGLFQEMFQSANGCDSIVNIDLLVAEGNEVDEIINACDEWTSPSGELYTSSGTYTELFNGSTGCDSIINYVLTINTVSTVASLISALTVEAAEAGATYQWVDCNNNNMPIPGANGKIYVASTNGDYACMVTKNGCTEMTNCVRVGSLGLDNNDNAFTIYPNPSNGVFAIELPNVVANTVVSVSNAAGQIVYTTSINSSTSTIDVSNVEAGIYFVTITNKTGSAKKSIIID